MHHRIPLLLVAVDSVTDSTGAGAGLHHIATQVAVDLTTDSTGISTGGVRMRKGRVALEPRSDIFVTSDVYSRVKRFRIGLLMAKSL